jgi:hypothetical protein
VASETQFSMGTLASEKYFLHYLSQLYGSSLEYGGKSNFGLAMVRLNEGVWSLIVLGL